MEQKEYGIVIRAFHPHKQKLSIVTQNMGKINAISHTPLIASIRPGMLLSFLPERAHETTWRCTTFELLGVPRFGCISNLTCFHHLAELCYYAIPLVHPCKEVFFALKRNLCFLEINDDKKHTQHMLHMLMTAELLMLIGFYPESTQLSSLFVDFAKAETINCLGTCIERGLTNQTAIQEWIMHILSNHPCAKLFKTPPFMYDQKS